MAICIEISDKVGVRVEGKLNDETGAAKAFDFVLICRRLSEDELTANVGPGRSIKQFLADVVEDWKGVKAADGSSVAYSAEALEDLLNKFNGLGHKAFMAYLGDVQVKEKN